MRYPYYDILTLTFKAPVLWTTHWQIVCVQSDLLIDKHTDWSVNNVIIIAHIIVLGQFLPCMNHVLSGVSYFTPSSPQPQAPGHGTHALCTVDIVCSRTDEMCQSNTWHGTQTISYVYCTFCTYIKYYFSSLLLKKCYLLSWHYLFPLRRWCDITGPHSDWHGIECILHMYSFCWCT